MPKLSRGDECVAQVRDVNMSRLTQSMVYTLLPLAVSYRFCEKVATITKNVESSTGASAGPTTPTATMKPSHSVAVAAAQSVLPSAYLNMPKKSAMGRKSKRIFIGQLSRIQTVGLKSSDAEFMQ